MESIIDTAVAPDGARIAYQARGTGRALLLLSGQACSHRWWDPVRADFEAQHTAVTMDYRGTGDSDATTGPYSTQGFADDAVAVLDELGVEQADVYGTSMGGRVAQWLAVHHPGRVRRLVLGCTSAGGPHSVERSDAVRRSLAGPDAEQNRRALLELMYTPGWLATHPGPHATLGDPGMSRQSRNLHLRASAAHDCWDALPRISAPTLVVHGSDDVLNPVANAELLAARIPDAKLEIVPGARHAYFEEHRETAGGLVRAFLEQ
jgi:pimeloyl-ACP methyl ester carboxylesterase